MADDFLHDPLTVLWQGAASTLASLDRQELTKQLTDLEATGQYVAEIKEDGHYTTIFAHHSGNQFYSRNVKRQRCFELERLRLPDGLILAGELGSGTQYAVNKRASIGYEYAMAFRLLAVPHYLRDRYHANAMTLNEVEQRSLLEIIWNDLDAATSRQIQLVPRFSSGFATHYANTVDGGGEGLVLKLIDSIKDTTYRPGQHFEHWIKVKKTITVDLVITDVIISSATTFKDREMASAIICGAYVNDSIVNLCSVGTMGHGSRLLFGKNKHEYIGRVVEIGGFERFTSGALRHPWFIRLRDDKRPEDCKMKEIERK